jgi:DeoR family transcriptional regulator, fructose operon transcriptional repressor
MSSGADQRRSQIISELNRARQLKVTDLSIHLGISEVSVRRDLQVLEDLGLLKRVHGGAVVIQDQTGSEELSTRWYQNLEKKERIGRAAAQLVQRGDNLIIDSGTTPLQVVRHLPQELQTSGNLTIITSSLPVVHEVGSHPGVHLILLGGVYLMAYDLVVGPQTIDNLKNLHADKLFLGTDGLTFTQGITTANVLEAEVDQAMVKASSMVIVVSDSSKIGVIGLASIMALNRIDKLVTDSDAPPDFVEMLRSQGVEVILA